MRTALRPQPDKARRKRFVVKVRPMGLRAGIDPARLNEWADDLEVDAFLDSTRRLRQHTKR